MVSVPRHLLLNLVSLVLRVRIQGWFGAPSRLETMVSEGDGASTVLPMATPAQLQFQSPVAAGPAGQGLCRGRVGHWPRL